MIRGPVLHPLSDYSKGQTINTDGQTVRYGKDGITAIFDNSVAGPTETYNHDPR